MNIYLRICDFDSRAGIWNRLRKMYHSQSFRFSADIERAAEFLPAMATSRNCGETHSETVRMKAKFRWRSVSG